MKPAALIILLYIHCGVDVPPEMDKHLKRLRDLGYITEDRKLTEKADDFFAIIGELCKWNATYSNLK